MNFLVLAYLFCSFVAFSLFSSADSRLHTNSIDYSWLQELPLDTYGRVLIGEVGSVLKYADRENTDTPPEMRGRVAFLARKKTSDWLLAIELSDPTELEEVLVFLHNAGVQRFVLFANLPGQFKTKNEVFLPQAPSPESSPFGYVNHARSYAWGNLSVRAGSTVQSKLARAFVTFFEARAGLETAILEAPGIAAGMDRLMAIVQKSADPLNHKAIPPSFGLCTANGACLGDRVIVSAGPDLRLGRVLGLGFPGAEEAVRVSLRIAVEGPRPSEHRFYFKHEVAEAKLGICWPLLSDFCVGHQVRGPGAKTFRIAGVFSHTGDLILQDEKGKLQRTSRRDLAPSAPRSAPVSTMDLAQRLNEPVLRLQDLLVEWSPFKFSATNLPNPWKECSNPKLFGHPLGVREDGTIDPACVPDTLYSWANMGLIDYLAHTNGVKTWKDLISEGNGIYLSATPASTFGYGAMDESGGYALRMKLRAGVKFRFVEFDPVKLEPKGTPVPPGSGMVLREFPKPNCSRRPIAEARETVYVRYWSFKSAPGDEFPAGLQEAGLEFIICSRSVLESWSFGTREFYDELVRDVRRFTMAEPLTSAPSYIRRFNAGDTQPRILDILTDGHPFTQQHLINVLRRQFVMSLREEGRIYVNPELGSASELERRHFQTKKRSWFSPEGR